MQARHPEVEIVLQLHLPGAVHLLFRLNRAHLQISSSCSQAVISVICVFLFCHGIFLCYSDSDFWENKFAVF